MSDMTGRSETDLVLGRVDRVKLASPPGKPGGTPQGAIAQLVERLHGMQEVRSSILLSSTARQQDPADRFDRRDLLVSTAGARINGRVGVSGSRTAPAFAELFGSGLSHSGPARRIPLMRRFGVRVRTVRTAAKAAVSGLVLRRR